MRWNLEVRKRCLEKKREGEEEDEERGGAVRLSLI